MRHKITGLIILALMVLVFSACSTEAGDIAKEAQQAQSNSLSRASAQFPAPQLEHFSTRATLFKWFERQDVQSVVYSPPKAFQNEASNRLLTRIYTDFYIRDYRPN